MAREDPLHTDNAFKDVLMDGDADGTLCNEQEEKSGAALRNTAAQHVVAALHKSRARIVPVCMMVAFQNQRNRGS